MASSESSGPELAERRREAQGRARARIRRCLADVAYSSDPQSCKAALSFLERASVKPKTSKAYREEVEKFVGFADLVSAPLGEDADVDVCLVSCMNKLYFEEHQS